MDRDLRSVAATGLIVAAVVVGVVVRFVAASPMWLDEALSADISSLGLGEIGDALRQDGHPPLYYYLLHGWQKVVGDSDFALRSFSGVVGVATLALTYPLVRRLSDPRTAVFAVAVVASSPFFVRYATETRMYAMVMLIVTVGWLLYDRALESPTVPRLAAVVAVVGVAVWTHYWAFFLLAAVGCVLIVEMLRSSDPRAVRRVLVATCIGGLAFIPWVDTFLFQRAHTGTPWAAAARPTVVAAESLLVFSGQAAAEPYLLLAVLSACVVLAYVVDQRGPIVLRATGNVAIASTVAVATLLIGATASIVGGSAFQGRYAAWVAPFVVFVVAVGLARLKSGWIQLAALTLILLLGFLATAHDIADDRSQSETFAAAINDRWADGDIVVFCPDQLGPATVRYLDADVDHLTYPSFDTANRIDWVDYAERHASADPVAFAAAALERVPAGGRIWLVTSDSYRAVGEQCSAIVTALTPNVDSELVVRADDVQYFEHGNLVALTVR